MARSRSVTEMPRRPSPSRPPGPSRGVHARHAGLLVGLIRPQQITVHYPGVLLGQLTYMIVFLPGGPLLLVGVGFLMFYSFLFLAAAAGGAGITGPSVAVAVAAAPLAEAGPSLPVVL